jgi:predicted metalloprotease
MRLDGRESGNIEDRRGGGGFGGGMGGFPVRIAGGGIGTVAIILLALFMGVDPSAILSGGGDAPTSQVQPDQRAEAPAGDDAPRRFVGQVLATTEDTWTAIFQRNGQRYTPPNLVLFSGATQTACGVGQSAMGPFYCPGDRKVYLDMAFFRDMERKLGAPGEFARAYVIAHEVGHHVQTLLGITERVDGLRRRASEAESNALSVRMELQADCFAGIWAKYTETAQQFMERGDLEAGLNAAAAVGDDRLQRRSQGTVVPESFTHGSSAQRVRWFRRGFDSGDVRECDSFGAAQL